MRLPLFFMTAITAAAFFWSCDPCNNLDCAVDDYYGQFRIVDENTGRDLVFGSTRIYTKSEIRFFALNGTDTTFFDYQPIQSGSAGYDSILVVRFFPKTDIAYMQLNNTDVDTLKMTYQTKKTKCCGNITKITNFRYNDKTDIPGSEGTQELRK